MRSQTATGISRGGSVAAEQRPAPDRESARLLSLTGVSSRWNARRVMPRVRLARGAQFAEGPDGCTIARSRGLEMSVNTTLLTLLRVTPSYSPRRLRHNRDRGVDAQACRHDRGGGRRPDRERLSAELLQPRREPPLIR